MNQRIEALDEALMADLAAKRNWVREHYAAGAGQDYDCVEGKLRLLETILDKGIPPDETLKLQCFGVTFADALAQELGLTWVVAEDETGRGPALTWQGTSAMILPLTSLSQGVEGADAGEVRKLFAQACAALREARASAAAAAALPTRGFVSLLRVAQVRLLVHWSTPLLGLGFGLPMAFIAQDSKAGSGWPVLAGCTIAFLAVVAAHEVGHALVALCLSLRIQCIVLHGKGGACIADGPVTPVGLFLFSAGGLLMQAALFVAQCVWFLIFGTPQSPMAISLFLFLGVVNVMLFIDNTWPRLGNDGEAMIRALRLWRSHGRAVRIGVPPSTSERP